MEKRFDEKEETGQPDCLNMRDDYIRASLALSHIPGIGAGRIKKIFEHFENPMSVFSSDLAEIAGIDTIGAVNARAITCFREWRKIDQLINSAEKHQFELLTPIDACYPNRLKHIYDPPAVLWVRGDPEVLKHEYIAIVGTRKPTKAGREITERLTSSLLDCSAVGVVSGLAYGVDALAHLSAIEKKRSTVAVLGSGVDRIYPSGNIRLAYRILEQGGALISEFPPGTSPEAHHFPIRNRIVSGISLGILVTETGLNGGSMITVSLGLDQGREVFVVPQDISNERGAGCNAVIQRGWGKLVFTVSHILEDLPVSVHTCDISDADIPLFRRNAGNSVNSPKRELNHHEAKIITLLTSRPHHIDEMSGQLKVGSHMLLSLLLQLELDGFVVQKPGKNFCMAD